VSSHISCTIRALLVNLFQMLCCEQNQGRLVLINPLVHTLLERDLTKSFRSFFDHLMQWSKSFEHSFCIVFSEIETRRFFQSYGFVDKDRLTPKKKKKIILTFMPHFMPNNRNTNQLLTDQLRLLHQNLTVSPHDLH